MVTILGIVDPPQGRSNRIIYEDIQFIQIKSAFPSSPSILASQILLQHGSQRRNRYFAQSFHTNGIFPAIYCGEIYSPDLRSRWLLSGKLELTSMIIYVLSLQMPGSLVGHHFTPSPRL